ncbi:MAG: PKD domain-containing protein [Candidatus Cloacimonetes bacterium]|nr:PKD domain-containing protein [Candidatus Cloacimonadota bacterium]
MKKLSLFVIITLLASVNLSAFAGGDGSAGDPYQVSNVTELQDVGNYLSSHFIQTADIDATATSGWNGGEGFIPIGSSYPNYYTGAYDGQGHTINYLYVNRPATNYQGLFGRTDSATIENLGVTDVYVNGNSHSGGLVGYNGSSSISNCYSAGSVSGSGYPGGLVGENIVNSSITDCYSAGSVTGTNHAGGLVGRNYGCSIITNCYSTGSATGTYYVGGLVGRNVNSSTITDSYSTGSATGTNYVGGLVGDNSCSIITNCYSTGSVTGTSYTGGLVGYNYLNSSISNCYSTGSVSGGANTGGLVGRNCDYSSITNCYCTGNVTGTSYTGGLVGQNSYSSSITNCYCTGSVTGTSYTGGLVGYNFCSVTDSFWDTQTSGQSASAGGTGKITAEMQDVATFTDLLTVGLSTAWDFIGNPNDDSGNNDYWDIIPYINDNYPFLTWQVDRTNFTATPTEMFIGTPVQFTDTSINNPTGWQWDFENDETYDSIEQNPSHTYSSSGIYTVKLTVTDGIEVDSLVRADYIAVNNTPLPPQNVQITLSGDDAIISWDAVTHDIDGLPLTPSLYVLQYSEVAEDSEFYYLYYVLHPNTSFNHIGVLEYGNNGAPANHMFYRVMAIKTYSTRQLTFLDELNISQEPVRWSEVKLQLESMTE